MHYRTRVKRAFYVALIMHVILLVLPTTWSASRDAFGVTPSSAPLVLNLAPREQPPMRLVDATAPADQPAQPDTDLIAEHDSNARDADTNRGIAAAPRVDILDEFDEIPVPRGAAGPPALPAAVPALADAPSPGESAPKPAEAGLQPVEAVEPPQPEPAPEIPEPIQLAKADTLAGGPEPTDSRGRVEGGVKNPGSLAFEAKKHELAPYLKDIKTRVERRWKALIALRYSGSQPTKAVVDCAITPKGTLKFATIVDRGSSATFGPLCEQALKTAAPFPPYPFDVSPIYQNDCIEIRWTFSFLHR
ncbi:MAG: hypothetical protein GY851_25430 [bacterium]|nr:hypothetical protein [bacterium]